MRRRKLGCKIIFCEKDGKIVGKKEEYRVIWAKPGLNLFKKIILDHIKPTLTQKIKLIQQGSRKLTFKMHLWSTCDMWSIKSAF